jgi:hypothetical protein
MPGNVKRAVWNFQGTAARCGPLPAAGAFWRWMATGLGEGERTIQRQFLLRTQLCWTVAAAMRSKRGEFKINPARFAASGGRRHTKPARISTGGMIPSGSGSNTGYGRNRPRASPRRSNAGASNLRRTTPSDSGCATASASSLRNILPSREALGPHVPVSWIDWLERRFRAPRKIRAQMNRQ